MVRLQIRLKNEQHSILKRLAVERKVSMSALIRQAVDAYISSENMRVKKIKQRALSAVGKFRSKERNISTRHDTYLADDFK